MNDMKMYDEGYKMNVKMSYNIMYMNEEWYGESHNYPN